MIEGDPVWNVATQRFEEFRRWMLHCPDYNIPREAR